MCVLSKSLRILTKLRLRKEGAHMRIAICDDNQIEVDLFKEHISGFLRRKGDYRYEISEYSAGYPLVEDVKEGNGTM